MKVKIQGFPTEISKEIVLPNMGELLNMPFFKLATVEDFRKYGTDFQRELMDLVPLKGEAPYTAVTFQVQYLYPGTAPLPERIGYLREWHMDALVQDCEIGIEKEMACKSHLLLSDCECLTEFNDQELILSLDDDIDLKALAQVLNEDNVGLSPKKMEPNRIYSFDSHLHRIVMPTKPQLRLIFRVTETEGRPPVPIEESKIDFGGVGLGTRQVPTIKKSGKKIILDSGYSF